jgi:hypothetical protein
MISSTDAMISPAAGGEGRGAANTTNTAAECSMMDKPTPQRNVSGAICDRTGLARSG